MKKNNIYCLIAAMALTACATDNDITSQAYLADDDNAVSIASATRGAIATADAPVKSFHLINTTQRDKYHTKYECGFMLDGDTYKPINGKVMWYNEADDNGQMTANVFEAFTPFTTADNNSSFTDFKLPTNQSTADLLETADWMTATVTTPKTIDASGNAVPLSLLFSHRLAKLHFDVTTLKDDANNISSGSLKVVGIITPYYNRNDKTIEAIVDPRADYSNKSLIDISTDRGETLSIAIPQGLSFAEGKQYNFTLLIGHDKMSISVSVTEWTETTIDLGDDYEATQS